MLDLSGLPKTDLGTVHCLNLFRLFRGEYLIPLEGEADGMLIQIDDQPLLDVRPDLVSVVFYAPFGTVALATELALVDLLCDRLLPGWRNEDPKKLRMEWRAVYALEAAAGQSVFAGLPVFVVNVTSATEMPKGPDTLPVRMTIGGQTFGGQLSLANGAAAQLFPYLPKPDRESTVPEVLSIRFFPRAAGPVADFEAFMGLSKGDVLILPGCSPGQLPLTLQIENGVEWHGTCDEQGNFTLIREENLQ